MIIVTLLKYGCIAKGRYCLGEIRSLNPRIESQTNEPLYQNIPIAISTLCPLFKSFMKIERKILQYYDVLISFTEGLILAAEMYFNKKFSHADIENQNRT